MAPTNLAMISVLSSVRTHYLLASFGGFETNNAEAWCVLFDALNRLFHLLVVYSDVEPQRFNRWANG